MPISLVPIATWVLLFVFLGASAFRGRRAFRRAAFWSSTFVVAVFSYTYAPGGLMWVRASRGNPEQQFEYARWKENHIDQINRIMFWPGSPDVAGGYYWLSKAADQQFPPAMFALGVRLKYGEHVPKPQNWIDTGGNVFPQLQSGQTLIDRAHALGFKEPVHEELYYWECFRR